MIGGGSSDGGQPSDFAKTPEDPERASSESKDVDKHHEGGWREVGHSIHDVFLMCGAHHQARHDGQLIVKGDAEGELQFFLADGTRLVSPGNGGRGQGRGREDGPPEPGISAARGR